MSLHLVSASWWLLQQVEDVIGQNSGELPINIVALRMRELRFARSGCAVGRMMSLQKVGCLSVIMCPYLRKMQK